jgi:hypothetical protein
MVAALRLFGSVASGGANLLLYGTILALWPALESCAHVECGIKDWPPPIAIDTWRPFIDNAGPEGTRSRGDPECPMPRGTGDDYSLEAAPLPGGYDPHGFGERQVYACVLVAADGEILGVRMLQGTGRQGGDAGLVRTIRNSWRFRRHEPEAAPSWQRVRLDSGSVDGPMWHPPPML